MGNKVGKQAGKDAAIILRQTADVAGQRLKKGAEAVGTGLGLHGLGMARMGQAQRDGLASVGRGVASFGHGVQRMGNQHRMGMEPMGQNARRGLEAHGHGIEQGIAAHGQGIQNAGGSLAQGLENMGRHSLIGLAIVALAISVRAIVDTGLVYLIVSSCALVAMVLGIYSLHLRCKLAQTRTSLQTTDQHYCQSIYDLQENGRAVAEAYSSDLEKTYNALTEAHDGELEKKSNELAEAQRKNQMIAKELEDSQSLLLEARKNCSDTNGALRCKDHELATIRGASERCHEEIVAFRRQLAEAQAQSVDQKAIIEALDEDLSRQLAEARAQNAIIEALDEDLSHKTKRRRRMQVKPDKRRRR